MVGQGASGSPRESEFFTPKYYVYNIHRIISNYVLLTK